MDPDSLLTGDNAAWLEALHEQLHADPTSLDPATRTWLSTHRPHRPRTTAASPASIFHGGAGATFADADRQAKVARLINAHRVQGHGAARIDPLGRREAALHPELDPAYYGLGPADMDATVATNPMFGMPAHASVREILGRLREVYCGPIGTESMNIRENEQKHWVLERLETLPERPALPRAAQVRTLDMLTRADGFERYLGARFQGYKRFSLEGGESLIPLLDMLFGAAAEQGVREAVIGMAHRGRLNVLLNILNKPPSRMLAEFRGETDESAISGDVKYHLGYSCTYRTAGQRELHLSLCFNPSHLEAVNPVAQGRVRAKQDRYGDRSHRVALPVLIHGDAAFAGQGIVPEVLNLSDLPGYRTGGTIHVVVNNQIGFTTTPTEGRSTPYCTDPARMLGIPIFHVNGEDLDAVARVVDMSVAWRQRFGRDVVIDMYCYRRWGHNETDEPAYTQPRMYTRIGELGAVRDRHAARLVERGIVTVAEAEGMARSFRASLDTALHDSQTPAAEASELQGIWSRYHSGAADEAETAVAEESLRGWLLALNAVPEGFQVHPKLQRQLFRLREEQAAGRKPLDWAAGELLAYASLVTAGHPVRLSGQDAGRGTFSHRHAALVDQRTGEKHVALQHLLPGQAPFNVFNSLLSEAAVLGFEYGYSLDYPEALVIWEAQFGDFANGAQIIIDNFLASGEAKWNRLSGLVLFLPHGYEGQGPEHSSARPERFLAMCAEGNLQVCNPTTPAQMFHLLRRQVLRRVRDPLIVLTPKSLLRTAQSSLADLASGRFASVIGDGEGRSRLVFCSGKVYYDLVAARGARNVALARVEQLYPFPEAEIRAEMARHPGADVWWCQEEPANMGAWPFLLHQAWLGGPTFRYAGRQASAAPATGYPARHAAQQRELVETALGS